MIIFICNYIDKQDVSFNAKDAANMVTHLLYKQLAANPSLIRYSKSPESEFFDTTSVTFDNCGRMFMSGNDWTENNLQMRFCPKCGRYMSKLEKLCWENLPKNESYQEIN